MVPSKIDPTYRAYCPTHGPSSPQTYLGRRYGCYHCNPTQPERILWQPPEPIDFPPWADGEPQGLPDWMTESGMKAAGETG